MPSSLLQKSWETIRFLEKMGEVEVGDLHSWCMTSKVFIPICSLGAEFGLHLTWEMCSPLYLSCVYIWVLAYRAKPRSLLSTCCRGGFIRQVNHRITLFKSGPADSWRRLVFHNCTSAVSQWHLFSKKTATQPQAHGKNIKQRDW